MAIGDVTFYPNYAQHVGFSASAEPSASGETYTCSGGETTGALYDLLDNKNTSLVTFDTNGESSIPVVNLDLTSNITGCNFAIIDGNNLGTAGAGVQFRHDGGGTVIDTSTAYAGPLGSAMASLSVAAGTEIITVAYNNILLALFGSTYTDNDFQLYLWPDGTYSADAILGEIAFGVSFTPSIAPDTNIVESSNYNGVTVNTTLGGQKQSFKRFSERKSWSLTWSVLSEADKTSMQTVWNITEGPRYPFWIDLGEAATPKLYYVRFAQNSLQVRKLTSQAYEVSVVIESEV